ncbi:LacI family DNA-binding transcriptional regulator [Vibrio ulleungensis]|uniref:LacI family DNA-binding transcriptional regulator n=1 Tax=Vibrio ulleungensis TaxID=2807619 RepID=A0ABS2HD05_9VIBR|nr:LacI family DNA-binding transcriptional regulator [Vibrio ulleungensis]MBM7035475.1 LacI family DNA-binding transcriptional regulator [Vibrio ulleungensis]
MPTIKEVSLLANVSKATVSRALNGHPSVKEANRKKVFDAIEELGFKPNAFAQALASNRSNSIGMLVGSLDGSFYGPLMHNVECIVREKGNHLIVTSGQESRDIEKESIEFLRSRLVDGLIIHSDQLSDTELIETVEQNDSTIILNRFIPEIGGHCVVIDNELGGYIATKHLIDMGHTEIACITGQLSKIDSRERLQGYRKALEESGLPFSDSKVIEGRYDHQGNHAVARRLLDRCPNITALFCQNDNIALAVYDIAAERELKIGVDLSIVGFDNDNHAQHIRPSLTTVDFPVPDMGIEAAKRLFTIIENKSCTEADPIKLLPRLIERHSVLSIQ